MCSADELPFGDATFDSVSVRFGYMFFPDMDSATAEFARVLKPGGRLCASVWVKPEENPWTTIAMQAIATETVVAPPDPDGPNMFRCAAPGYITALYEERGPPRRRRVGHRRRARDAIARTVLGHDQRARLTRRCGASARRRTGAGTDSRRVIAKVSTFEKDDQVRVPGIARCIVGTKNRSDAPPASATGRDPPTRAGRPNRIAS